MLKNIAIGIIILLTCAAFVQQPSLKGTWQFAGGVYNGKAEGAPADYQLQRNYNDTTFDAFVLEKGEQPVKYQSGKYIFQSDSCLETETFNIQSARLTGITLHYHCIIRHDSLIFAGKLPTGMLVQEYWKRIK